MKDMDVYIMLKDAFGPRVVAWYCLCSDWWEPHVEREVLVYAAFLEPVLRPRVRLLQGTFVDC
jgi:hypothetical protein